MHFYHLKEVTPVVHFLWVGRVCAGCVQVVIHLQKLIIGHHETQPCNLNSEGGGGFSPLTPSLGSDPAFSRHAWAFHAEVGAGHAMQQMDLRQF